MLFESNMRAQLYPSGKAEIIGKHLWLERRKLCYNGKDFLSYGLVPLAAKGNLVVVHINIVETPASSTSNCIFYQTSM